MWRETNIFGVYLPPLLVYTVAALVAYLQLRALFNRFRAFRWFWNPPLAEAAIFVCILALLVGFL